MLEWREFAEGGIGAVFGAVLIVVGLKSRLDGIERRHTEFREETQAMQKEIRDDIKMLISKTVGRRKGD